VLIINSTNSEDVIALVFIVVKILIVKLAVKIVRYVRLSHLDIAKVTLYFEFPNNFIKKFTKKGELLQNPPNSPIL
jgi:hypothetical protein